jgi:uncharacterized membrane protein YphA (DoxX/SURF4 family)
MFLQKINRLGKNKDFGIFLLRLALGSFFLANGIFKFENLKDIIGFFGHIGLAPFWVYVVTFAEIFSGLSMILGIFLWASAALIAIIMIVAIYTATGPNPQGQPFILHFISGWGPAMVYGATAICIAFCGAGRWSLSQAWSHIYGTHPTDGTDR